MKIDFQAELNPEQLKVASYTQSPLLVLAGAGSGKTRSIIYRCAYLIQHMGIKPWNILVVTFTNKAANELKQRLESLLKISVSSLWVGTFHSLCLRILRMENEHLPLKPNFSIYDTDAQKSLLKKILKEQGIDSQKVPINRVMSRISRHKNRLQMPQDLPEGYYEQASDPFNKAFHKVYTLYQQALLFNQAMDFDDILYYTAKLFQDHPEVRAKYGQRFQHVMIDEYQDTNMVQFEIIRLIVSEHHNLCVVGDDDQAIYGFRGATVRNILEFEKDYPDVKAIRLEQNYRSTMGILNLANAIIKQNRRRHVKDLWSERGEGQKPVLTQCLDENDEAEIVSQRVLELKKKGTSLGEIAVLYRTNSQSRVFENAFMQHRIPHVIVGSLHFYQRKEIRDMLAYLSVLLNTDDSESLLRIINEPARGIGNTTVNRIISYANRLRIGIWQAIGNLEAIEELGSAARKRVAAFYEMMQEMRQAATHKSASQMVELLLEELQLLELYRKGNDPQDIARAENLMEFMNSASEFDERFAEENDRTALLSDFLPFVALQTDLDRVKDEDEALKLMTLHNAKGLEFEHVFIVGLEQELLPHRLCMNTREEIEEERRLLYVGITRAKDGLYLSYATERRLYGIFDHSKPSVFLQGLAPDLFFGSIDEAAHIPAPRRMGKFRHKHTDKDKYYYIGQDVWHEEYGAGKVLNVSGTGSDALLTVSFAKGALLKVYGTFLKTSPTDS